MEFSAWPSTLPTPVHPFLVGLLLVALAACDETPSNPGSKSRSDAILATPGQESGPEEERPSAVQVQPTAPGATKEPLCDAMQGELLPTTAVRGVAAPGQEFSGGVVGGGRLTWVNLWAAWCEPCKKEIPLLFRFQREFAKAGLQVDLAFVSIDDDERQLARYLKSEPPDRLTKTYWLSEGATRDEWLKGAGVASDPRLPIQLLVGKDRKVMCRIEGAVEESDLPEIEAVLRGR